MSKKSSSDLASCKVAVEELLRQTNKPYNVQLVIDYTASKWGKATVQKALDALVDEKKLKFVEIGRGKLYLYDQSNATVLSDEEIAKMKAETEAVLEDNRALKSELTKLQKQYTIITAEAKTEKLQQVRKSLEMTEKEKSAILKSMDSEKQAIEITDKDMDEIKILYKKTMMLWRERKEKVVDIVDMIADGTDQSRKEVMKQANFSPDNWELYKQFIEDIPLNTINLPSKGSVKRTVTIDENEEADNEEKEKNDDYEENNDEEA